MKKYGGVRYNSMWDWSTWLIVGLVTACCAAPCLLDGADGIWPTVVCLVSLAFVLAAFLGTYYRIDGNNLVVYVFFRPTAFPIDKIKSVKPTRSILSSPATSIVHRLAITFTDRKVLKSADPLIISPVRQQEFIARLRSINPDIQ